MEVFNINMRTSVSADLKALYKSVIIIIILLSNAKVSFWCAKYRLKVAQRVKEPKSRSTLCSPIQHSLVR